MSNESNRVRTYNWESARPISTRSESVLERLLNNDLDSAKRQIREAANKRKMELADRVEAEHESLDPQPFRDRARAMIDKLRDDWQALKAEADEAGLTMTSEALDSLDDSVPDEGFDIHDLYSFVMRDERLDMKINAVHREVNLEVSKILDELEEQASVARRHILIASLTEEEQKVLDSVPQTEGYVSRLGALGA